MKIKDVRYHLQILNATKPKASKNPIAAPTIIGIAPITKRISAAIIKYIANKERLYRYNSIASKVKF